jgi:hypothetical protein
MHSAADACLLDAQERMPGFIAGVIDRGVRHLAFTSVLARDGPASSGARSAGATLFKMRKPIERTFAREMEMALLAAVDDLPAIESALDICLDDGLAARLDFAHLRDAAELACTAERIEFEELFCGASGRHVVRGMNPLRPEVHARGLATALDEWPVRHAVRSAWFTHLGEPLGQELAGLYRTLSRGMRKGKVREAQFMPPVVAGRAFESWGSRRDGSPLR